MKLLLASAIAIAFAISPVYAQQPADKDKAADAEASSKSSDSAEASAISDKPIAPEVMEVVNKKKKYTTSDLVKAQLDAVNKMPSNPG
jgi:hypothetical protein